MSICGAINDTVAMSDTSIKKNNSEIIGNNGDMSVESDTNAISDSGAIKLPRGSKKMEDFQPGGLRTRIWGLASIAGLFSRSSLCLEKRKNVRFLIFAKSHKVYDNEKEYYLAKYYNKTKIKSS